MVAPVCPGHVCLGGGDWAVRVKICGVTRVEDALAAARLGADAVGLNLYAPSPRCVGLDRAREIRRALPPLVEPVGLFVNADATQVRDTARAVGLVTVQLHGQETPDVLAELAELRLIKVFRIRDRDSLDEVSAYLAACQVVGRRPDALLFDVHDEALWGGSGKRFDWQLLTGAEMFQPYLLAGGLTPENVAEAIRVGRPWGVDVASGVESAPGIKDAALMRAFIERARQGAQSQV